MNKEYIGIVIEESLDDNRRLNGLNIRKLRITAHENPADRWHMYEVNVSADEIEELSKHITEDWALKWILRSSFVVWDTIKPFFECKSSWVASLGS